MPHKLIIGKHTAAACLAVDEAIDLYLKGVSSFWDITIPFRHGKSDIFSRALPGYFLGRCAVADPDIIMSGYGGDLVEGFSRDAKAIIASPKYQRLFPEVKLSETVNTSSEWKIEGRFGKVTAVGLGGSLGGKGYGLGVLDDFCKNRAEAESVTYRNSTWDSFVNDFMTRRAPVSITILVATSWHIDDIRGRVHKHMKTDPDFPQFRIIKFGAKNADGTYLFPERFGPEWYKSQYATLGRYASAGLLDGDPVPAEGNVAQVHWFKVVDSVPVGGTRVRGWDLAATAKKTACFTAGPRMSQVGADFYIDDMFHEQVAAGRVLSCVESMAIRDGRDVSQVVEREGGSAGPIVGDDIIKRLAGYPVYSTPPSGDKLTRALPFFAQAEAGHVFILRAEWTEAFLAEIRTFPFGDFKDMVDGAATAFNHLASHMQGATW